MSNQPKKFYIEGIALYPYLEFPCKRFKKNQFEVTVLLNEKGIEHAEAHGVKVKSKSKRKAPEYFEYEDQGYDGSYITVANSAVLPKSGESRTIYLYNEDGSHFKSEENHAIGNGTLVKVEALLFDEARDADEKESMALHGSRLYLNRAIIKKLVSYEMAERKDPLFDGEDTAPKTPSKGKAAKAKDVAPKGDDDFPDDEIPF